MAVYFLDSSGLVKRYIAETGSGWVDSLTLTTSGNVLYVARITGAEIISAITRRQRRGATTPVDATAAITAFRTDFAKAYFPIDVTPSIVARSMDLAELYGLRGYDAVQLAAVLELRDQSRLLNLPEPILIAADTELNSAALAEGLAVDDPNTH